MRLPPRILVSQAFPLHAYDLGYWIGMAKTELRAARRTNATAIKDWHLDLARSWAEESRKAYARIVADQHGREDAA